MKFKSTVNHDGKTYNAGDEVPSEITKEQLKALQDAGAVETGKEKKDENENPEDTGGEGGSETVNPENHTKQELLDLAKERGVEVEETATKAEIADALNG